MFGRIAVLIALVSILAGCHTGATPSEESQEAAPTLLVTVAPAVVAAMSTTLRALGVTAATRHITIRSPATGRISGINLKNGDIVRKGQLIGYVVNREIEAAQAGLEIARRLDPKGAAALGDSVNRYNKGSGIPVVAPDSGVVARPPVTSGQMVADLDPIAELIDPSSIYVEASIPVDQLHLVSPGMAATVTSPVRPGVAFPARVAALIPTFDAGSATAPVRLDFTGAQTIPETGAPVEARIITSSVPDAIVIPAVALFQDAGANRYHVFVAGADGKAHRVEVTIGMRDATDAQVLSGIKPGDDVITSGGYALSDGLKISTASTGT